MDIPLDEVIFFDAVTHHPSTGAVTDADSTPTFAVYEESTDTDIGVGGNLTKRTSLTGNYRGTFTISAANGFEVGKWYSVIASAAVNSIAGKDVVKNFRVVLAEAVTGEPKVDVGAFGGTGGTFSAGRPEVNTTHAAGTAWGSGAITAGSIAADAIGASELAADAVTEIRDAITGGAYALSTDANGRVRIVDGTAAGEIDTASGGIAHVILTDTLTTYTGNTVQTGDSFARIGLAGAGLTNVPWNASWDAEVQSEVDDALVALNLDHLLAVAAVTGDVVNSSVIARLTSKSATPAFTSYDNTTDSLEALQAEDDTTQAAIAALNNITAASVWAVGTRTLTALGFTLAASDYGTDWLTSTGLAASAAQEIRDAVTGGAYALSTDANGRVRIVDGTAAGEIDTVSGAVAHVVLTDTLTTYTGNTPQTGDSFARIGATGSGLTSLASAASIAALNNISAAQVNAEVVDALATDTYAEPGQGTPAATATLAAKIGYLYKAWRNKKTQTATTLSIFNDDATTVDHKSTVSDDGTTYTTTELITGP